MNGLPTLQDLLDPRGRADRSGLLKVAALLMAADILLVLLLAASGAGFTGPAALLFKLGSVWLATVAVAKRLHDLDLSAWWVAKALAAVVAWSIVVPVMLLGWFSAADATNPGHAAFWINLAATTTPVLGALVWLHLAPSSPGVNAYGPAPDRRGFSLLPARGFGEGVAAR